MSAADMKMVFRMTKDTLGPFLDALKDGVDKHADEIGNALARGGMMVSERMQTIIREKRHIVTGTLWRSIHVSYPTQPHPGDFEEAFGGAMLNAAPDGNGSDARQSRNRFVVEIGTWIYYAIYVEGLADGGYVYPAFKERSEAAMNYVTREVWKVLMQP